MTAATQVRTTPDLALLFGQASHVLSTELAAALGELGISPRSYCVLSKAMAAERTQGQLAELCLLDKTTMVVTLDELERLGYAERRPSPTDRRARVIAVTRAGQRIVAQADRIVAATYDDVLANLPAAERAVFVDALERLVRERLSTPPRCDRPPRRARVPR